MFKRFPAAAGLALALCAFGALAPGAVAPAMAQSSVCEKLGPMIQERQRLLERINSMGRRNVNPQTACGLFNQLAANGQRTIAFARENKDWCQIPDEFMNNLTGSQAQISRVRGQACNAARQQAQLQSRAQQQQRQQRENLGPFGGSDMVTGGAWRIPQGAL